MNKRIKNTLIFSGAGGFIGLSISHFIWKKGIKVNLIGALIGLGVGAAAGYFISKDDSEEKDVTAEQKMNRRIKFVRQ